MGKDGIVGCREPCGTPGRRESQCWIVWDYEGRGRSLNLLNTMGSHQQIPGERRDLSVPYAKCCAELRPSGLCSETHDRARTSARPSSQWLSAVGILRGTLSWDTGLLRLTLAQRIAMSLAEPIPASPTTCHVCIAVRWCSELLHFLPHTLF